ncbi:ribosomal protection-like ABC-F family protein [Faecalicoccus pleomorphus]|uniref:ribosomal protection-like ABC-F family protein n=1 Tax=Faecalicoccus pleomorphus TaxID=1323 RepID=UPI002942729D|nr:ABC-F type ribosomal protection protein [Faecalicoccus pleomorphus]
MSMIQVEHLSFSYDSQQEMLFDDVSFSIDTDWKLGLVGRNGRGKTTFLSLLMKKYPYQGKIRSSVSFDYFPFVVADQEQWTIDVVRSIYPLVEDWQIQRELSYLQVEDDVLWREFSTLSQGEQTKVLLAVLFLKPGNFLLIDEPTNHLDAKARVVLMHYLQRKKGFILVSHDRKVLDGCVDHILAINRQTIEVQAGNYSSWFDRFETQQEKELQEDKRLRKDIRRLKSSALRTSMWSDKIEASKIGAADKGFVGHKSAKMMQRSKNIAKRQQAAIEQKEDLLKNVEEMESLQMKPLNHPASVLISLDEVTPLYDGKVIGKPQSFLIEKGQRIFLDGKNGCGKSSLLKLLVDPKREHRGKIQWASNLIVSYVSQDASFLQGTLSQYAKQYEIDETLYRTLLRKMGFERWQFDQKIQSYSDGQKKKVMLARSLCEKAHIYIWDEPLNFIDIYTRMQIEKMILSSQATILIVEHDIAFRENVATKVVVL